MDDETAHAGWYWASAVYKAVHPGSLRRRHLWERVVFILRASHESEAWDKANKIALSKVHGYAAAGGDRVEWTLQRIDRVQPLFDADVGEGTEVFWEFYEKVDRPEL